MAGTCINVCAPLQRHIHILKHKINLSKLFSKTLNVWVSFIILMVKVFVCLCCLFVCFATDLNSHPSPPPPREVGFSRLRLPGAVTELSPSGYYSPIPSGYITTDACLGYARLSYVLAQPHSTSNQVIMWLDKSTRHLWKEAIINYFLCPASF